MAVTVHTSHVSCIPLSAVHLSLNLSLSLFLSLSLTHSLSQDGEPMDGGARDESGLGWIQRHLPARGPYVWPRTNGWCLPFAHLFSFVICIPSSFLIYVGRFYFRERELFIGTRFSNLYISVDTPARGRVVDWWTLCCYCVATVLLLCCTLRRPIVTGGHWCVISVMLMCCKWWTRGCPQVVPYNT